MTDGISPHLSFVFEPYLSSELLLPTDLDFYSEKKCFSDTHAP